MPVMKRLLPWIVAGVFAPVLACAAEAWIGTWAMSPTGLPTVPRLGTFVIPPPIMMQGTMRYRLRISQGGTRIRLRFTNEYGDRPLTIAAASVGLADTALNAAAGSLKRVTFSGAQSVTVPAGAPALSDPIDLRVMPLADLVVSVHVPAGVPVNRCPEQMPVSSQAAIEGADATLIEQLPSSMCTFLTRPIVSSVAVSTNRKRAVVVALGDSITDGTVDPATGERGWPGALARRLRATGVSVVNAGISGNRLLQTLPMFGTAALARFDRDVLAVPGVSHIVLLEGINDIGTSGPGGMFGDTPLVDPQALISAYGQIIARAHEHGIRIYGATILPFEGAMYYSTDKERVRIAVNDWIRTAGQFDGFIDFDAALRDPNRPGKLRAEYDSGDHLHPNPAGQRRMGELIDLKLFR